MSGESPSFGPSLYSLLTLALATTYLVQCVYGVIVVFGQSLLLSLVKIVFGRHRKRLCAITVKNKEAGLPSKILYFLSNLFTSIYQNGKNLSGEYLMSI